MRNKNRRHRWGELNSGWREQVKRQRFKYNLLGLAVLFIIVVLATNAAGVAQALARLLAP